MPISTSNVDTQKTPMRLPSKLLLVESKYSRNFCNVLSQINVPFWLESGNLFRDESSFELLQFPFTHEQYNNSSLDDIIDPIWDLTSNILSHLLLNAYFPKLVFGVILWENKNTDHRPIYFSRNNGVCEKDVYNNLKHFVDKYRPSAICVDILPNGTKDTIFVNFVLKNFDDVLV